jgi:hypothetical protein
VANRSPRRMFSHEDDCRILELRAQKVPMIKIAQLLDRNVKSVTVRYGRILSAGVLA